MKPTLAWHRTPFGRLCRSLGGLELAVPVMILVAVALAWGTYLDATFGAKVAKARVYGSWWFIGLMVLVCSSLVFAVVTRFPWKRKHVGFITVHASLITMIAGGFWSLFGRLEGRLALREGTEGAVVEVDSQRLEVVEHAGDAFGVVASVPVDGVTGTIRVGDLEVEIVERWGNTGEETVVLDDGPEPLRAVEIAFGQGSAQGVWIGEAARSGGPASLHGLTIEVLGEGEPWSPPPPGAGAGEEPDYIFDVRGERVPLAAEGATAFEGWSVVKVRRYASAMVGQGGLVEGGSDNPAVEVTISDGRGNVERHTAFQRFPDMVMSKAVEGEARSGARLLPGGRRSGASLVIYGEPSALRAAFVGPGAAAQEFSQSAPLPWTIEAGGHRVTVLSHVSRARTASRIVEAPPASEYRPAVLVRVAGAAPEPLQWKSTIAVAGAGDRHLRFGPLEAPLPFAVELVDFRKQDYPGTTMAMAYESDVAVTIPGQAERRQAISMNKPFAYRGWKVYQSGFMGEDVSIFSVMRDPGLPLTYVGCTGLCVGILLTFYVRSLSWGHPGIAIPGFRKEGSHGSPAADRVPPAGVGADGARAAGVSELVGPDGVAADPGRRAGDAAGVVRAEPGGPTDRPVTLVN